MELQDKRVNVSKVNGVYQETKDILRLGVNLIQKLNQLGQKEILEKKVTQDIRDPPVRLGYLE